MNERNEEIPLVVLTVKEVTELLRVSERWLRNKRKDPDGIPFFNIGNEIYYEEKDVLSWVKKQKQLCKVSTKR